MLLDGPEGCAGHALEYPGSGNSTLPRFNRGSAAAATDATAG
ncbi:hypothetical protein I546_5963 [Mycobacterium kansasii 732]|nr:hypothetical protein I546_5963 [Mycobacterium kansasii 732]